MTTTILAFALRTWRNPIVRIAIEQILGYLLALILIRLAPKAFRLGQRLIARVRARFAPAATSYELSPNFSHPVVR